MLFKIKILCLVLLLGMFGAHLMAQIPNAGFENWTAGEPDGWFTNNESGLIFVTQSTTSRGGSFAARGDVIDIGGFGFGPLLAPGNASGTIIGFPVSQRHQALTGYYQFTPNVTGLLQILVSMGIATPTDTIPVGAGAFVTSSAANSFTQFSAPIFYNPGANDPNWALITIQILGSGSFPPAGASMLIDDLSFGGTVGIEDEQQDFVVSDYELEQNYPNPFNPSTRISFSLPKISVVEIVIYDQLGQEVDRLQQGQMSAGNHTVSWSAENLPSGIYYYQLRAGDRKLTRKMMLMK
jgi:hypothetical protein